MYQLSAKANKDEYAVHMGKEVLLGKKVVTVIKHTVDGRSGTYEKGFKFTTNVYGGLHDAKTQKVSFDHGVTWNYGNKDSWSYSGQFKSTKTGRVRLQSDSQKEFAYDKIQAINARYQSGGF